MGLDWQISLDLCNAAEPRGQSSWGDLHEAEWPLKYKFNSHQLLTQANQHACTRQELTSMLKMRSTPSHEKAINFQMLQMSQNRWRCVSDVLLPQPNQIMSGLIVSLEYMPGILHYYMLSNTAFIQSNTQQSCGWPTTSVLQWYMMANSGDHIWNFTFYDTYLVHLYIGYIDECRTCLREPPI